MELRKRALGLSLGLVWGLTILFGTWWLLLRGSPGKIISRLGTVYLGYTYSWGGALIGFVWGFVDGFIGGFLIALFYNFFSKKFVKAEPSA